MHLSFLFLFSVTIAVAASRYKDAPYKVKESIDRPPHGWTRHGRAPLDHVLQLKIALPQPHFPILEEHLWQVSDPGHERYGAYLTKDEADALMAPHPESLDAVSRWLSSHGIEEERVYRSSAQDWVTIHVPVALAEEMLDTKYDIYIHASSGERVVRTTSYSLPECLHEHIELIQPTTIFARPRPLKSTLHWSNAMHSSSSPTGTITGPAGNQVDATCNSTITVSCLRQIYNVAGYNVSSNNGNKIGITAYEEQYANNQDLQQFLQQQNPKAYGANYTFVSINGWLFRGLNNQSSPGAEADLDIEFAIGLTYPTPAIFYSTGGSPPYKPDGDTPTNTNEPYTDWLDYMFSQEYLPQTVSTSYADDEQTVPHAYATRVCAGFAALGSRGVSLLFGSGDSGVGNGSTTPENQECYTNDGTNKTTFLPKFPASCPYVTSVGGTYLIPETAVNFSSGGFSDYFSRPKYQEAAVTRYLRKLTPGTYEGLYNPNGRGFPDVAAQSVNFHIVYQGQMVGVGGTSCSTPTFASFVSLLNDARINAGKPPLGFLNPWLYEKGLAGLNDITTGNNPGCGTEGFNATVGWDPVTGLGTPNFEKLLALAMRH